MKETGFSPEREFSVESGRRKCPIDALIVFGAGITTDANLLKKEMGAKLIGNENEGWRLPLPAKVRALAASELYMDGKIKDVIFTGGKVAEAQGISKSEAELMKHYFLKKVEHGFIDNYKRTQGKPRTREEIAIFQQSLTEFLRETENHVLLEDSATNTIENFAYTINYLDQNKDSYQSVVFLSNDFHIDRIIKLADKLKVDGSGLGSEESLKNSNIDTRIKQVLTKYYDIEANKEYRDNTLESTGPEDQSKVAARLGSPVENAYKAENRWSRGLDEIPEYWLSNVQFIEDPSRLKAILSSDSEVGKVLSKAGIGDIASVDSEHLRSTLGKIERKMPPEEWAQ